MWQRREIENYFCRANVLLAYARYDLDDDLFGQAECQLRIKAMRAVISGVSKALETLFKPDPWSADIKATDEFLDPLFKNYFQKLGLPLQLRKSDYHKLADLVPKDEIDSEVREKLDAIVTVAQEGRPQEEQLTWLTRRDHWVKVFSLPRGVRIEKTNVHRVSSRTALH